MAVLDLVPGLEVTICVDSQPLEEYPDDEYEEVPNGEAEQHKATRTVTRYIESTSEKEFAVHLSAAKGYVMDCDGILWRITIDGKLMDSPIFRKDVWNDCMSGDLVVTPIKERFSKIELDESKLVSVRTDAEDVKEVGEILVEVWRTSLKPCQGTTTDIDSSAVKIHEKALTRQAKSHSTTLGQATPTLRSSYFTSEKLDGEDKPQARFRFLYRSKKALKSLLILERTPTPEPEPIGLNKISASQRTHVERFIQGLVNGVQRASGTPDTKIKRERNSHWDDEVSRKKRKSGEKVTIDLTEDSD